MSKMGSQMAKWEYKGLECRVCGMPHMDGMYWQGWAYIPDALRIDDGDRFFLDTTDLNSTKCGVKVMLGGSPEHGMAWMRNEIEQMVDRVLEGAG